MAREQRGATCLLPRWSPERRGRELGTGTGAERGNLHSIPRASRNGLCPPGPKREDPPSIGNEPQLRHQVRARGPSRHRTDAATAYRRRWRQAAHREAAGLLEAVDGWSASRPAATRCRSCAGLPSRRRTSPRSSPVRAATRCPRSRSCVSCTYSGTRCGAMPSDRGHPAR